MSASLPTVAQLWAEFSGMVMPADAGEVQVQEMRRAFYAGFHALMSAQVGDAAAAATDDEQLAWMMRLQREIQSFFALIQEGRA